MHNEHTAEWNEALNTFLLDTDTLADTLYGHCMHTEVKYDAVCKLAADLANGRPLNATPAVAVPELLWLLLTETPDVAMRARALLRERLMAEHSESVARIKWRQDDAAREVVAFDDSEVSA